MGTQRGEFTNQDKGSETNWIERVWPGPPLSLDRDLVKKNLQAFEKWCEAQGL